MHDTARVEAIEAEMRTLSSASPDPEVREKWQALHAEKQALIDADGAQQVAGRRVGAMTSKPAQAAVVAAQAVAPTEPSQTAPAATDATENSGENHDK